MKLRRLVPCTIAAATFLTAPAYAQTPHPGFDEKIVDGNQVVKFTDDELLAPDYGALGPVIRARAGAARVGLIRPRVNFVSELVKSVENL